MSYLEYMIFVFELINSKHIDGLYHLLLTDGVERLADDLSYRVRTVRKNHIHSHPESA